MGNDAVAEMPAIGTPAAMAELADEMAEENFALAAGDGPTDEQNRVIVPKLRTVRARLKQAIKPLEWLGYTIIAAEIVVVVQEIDELLGDVEKAPGS